MSFLYGPHTCALWGCRCVVNFRGEYCNCHQHMRPRDCPKATPEPLHPVAPAPRLPSEKKDRPEGFFSWLARNSL